MSSLVVSSMGWGDEFTQHLWFLPIVFKRFYLVKKWGKVGEDSNPPCSEGDQQLAGFLLGAISSRQSCSNDTSATGSEKSSSTGAPPAAMAATPDCGAAGADLRAS
eukprot:2338385-Rhodomonas_salina.1